METTYIRVYRLPKKLTDGYCFGAGVPIPFINVDWFYPPPGVAMMPRDQLIDFIKAKVYYDPAARFLVLDDRPGESFVIEPSLVQSQLGR